MKRFFQILLFQIVFILSVCLSGYCANKYIVGCATSCVLDGSTTTNISDSSGGAGGAVYPTSSDNLYINGSSGNGTLTISTATTSVNDLDFTGWSGTLASGSANINVYGSMTTPATMTYSYSRTITFKATTTGKNIDFATNFNGPIIFDGVGGEWTLQKNFITSNNNLITLTNGSFILNNFNVRSGGFTSSGNVKGLSMGSGTWEIRYSSGWTLDARNLTFDPGTSTLELEHNGSINFNGGDLTYYNVVSQPVSGSANLTLNGSNTFNSFTATSTNGAYSLLIVQNTIQTASTWNITGSVGKVITLASNASGRRGTISKASGTVNFDYLTIQDISVEGGATWNKGTNSTFSTGCLGWVGNSTDLTRYWVTGGTGNWNSTTNWSLTSGGASGASIPSNADDCIFDSNSGSGTSTVNAVSSCKNLDLSNFSGTLAGSSSLFVHGNITFGASNTVTYTGAINQVYNGSDLTVNTAGKTLGQLTVNTLIKQSTLLGELALSARLALGTTACIFNTGNYSISANDLLISSSSAILPLTANFGSSNITITGTGTIVNISNQYNLDFNPGTSTIIVNNSSATAKTFAGGGQTFNHVTFSGDNITVTGSNTFNNFAINNAGLTNGLLLTASTTQTVTGTISTNGFASNLAKLVSTSAGSAATISKASGTVALDYMSIKDSTATGGASFYAGSHSTNVSGNTGWSFTDAPSGPIGIKTILGTPIGSWKTFLNTPIGSLKTLNPIAPKPVPAPKPITISNKIISFSDYRRLVA